MKRKAPLPSVLLAIEVLGGWLLGLVVPLALPLSFNARMASGSLFLALAAVIGALAIRAMSKAKTPIEPNSAPVAIVVGGPFRFSRNPLYVALISASLGIALMLANGWIVIGTVALAIALDRFVIPVEEKVLRETFADAYTAYRRSVRRWI